MKKYLFILTAVALAIAAWTVFGTIKTTKAETEAQRRRCITQYGWQIDEQPCDTQQIELPSPGGLVYEQYNKLQLQTGLDLTPYYGRTATRYTYRVYNHPQANGREVFANILVCDGRLIAGDIMVTAIDGFMHALSSKTYE